LIRFGYTLRNDAMSWFIREVETKDADPHRTYRDWKVIREKFLTDFDDLGENDDVRALKWERLEWDQKIHKTLMAFNNHIHELARKTNKDKDEILRKFKYCLPASIRNFVLTRNPQTVDDLIQVSTQLLIENHQMPLVSNETIETTATLPPLPLYKTVTEIDQKVVALSEGLRQVQGQTDGQISGIREDLARGFQQMSSQNNSKNDRLEKVMVQQLANQPQPQTQAPMHTPPQDGRSFGNAEGGNNGRNRQRGRGRGQNAAADNNQSQQQPGNQGAGMGRGNPRNRIRARYDANAFCDFCRSQGHKKEDCFKYMSFKELGELNQKMESERRTEEAERADYMSYPNQGQRNAVRTASVMTQENLEDTIQKLLLNNKGSS
jgi:hypothetical protein